ncbi:MAG: hypothetical protein KGQ49_05715, partial [Verrucomicrobia bacterium]|nr:hypothetical protein [Verrucomicrobiota bacterium]
LPPHIANSHILHTLQTFDPPGIFARSLQESFLLQLKAKGKEKTLTFTLIEQCYDDLLHGRYGQIRKKLKSEELKKALLDVSRLALRPAHSFQEERGAFLTVDLLIQKVDGGWTIELIEDDLPRVHLRSEYLDVETNGTEEKRALQELRTRAKWVVRSLSRRRKLLLEIGRQLVKTQARFLEQKGPLAPLSSRALAQKLEIHESTLSRALAGKYATTPRGILSLRSLVPTDSESENAKQMLVSLIAAEDKQNPYTDDQLADALKEKGFPIARRTIAKYRNRLKIGSASQRKNQITSLSVY